MGLVEGKHLAHLYYGKKTKNPTLDHHCAKVSFAPYFADRQTPHYPDTTDAEFPFFGSGDYRAEALKVRNLTNGADATLYIYKSARKFEGRLSLAPLPYAEADEDNETLVITMEDKVNGSLLELYFTVFPESDVISRYFVLRNKGKNDLRIEKAMCLSLDIAKDDLDMISLVGGYNQERRYQRAPLSRGNHSVYSRRGASSHHFNPFIMLADKKTREERGEAYGFNLVYSGSFLDEVEVSHNGSTRVLVGLGSDNFSYLLKSGEQFTSPEAIMTYTDKGLGQISRNMHLFTRMHILPEDKFEKRPVVLNSWEAVHFDIDEKLMIDFAKEAKNCGMDMLVMDDGWFGKRLNDRAGLGDWTENPDKFPKGLKAFVDKVKAQGIKFGIWIEPEMVNPDSDLYRAHPEWAIATPGYEPMLSRKQLILDMANPDVVAYLKESFAKVFGGVAIDYFKWDMNRNMSQVFSPALPPERQGESEYRYMLGVYDLLDWFGKQFPNAMIETCSGGGGRYDLGMMKFGTQVWTSDNTLPSDRIYIQHGSSFGYPAATMSCHVAKLQKCEDASWREYDFAVALGGPLGYEMNILLASEELKKAIPLQIAQYREYEEVILKGDLYRLINPVEKNGKAAYYYVDGENGRILLTYLQINGDEKAKEQRLRIARADVGAVYTDRLTGKRYSGEELRHGITFPSSTSGEYAKMFYLCKEEQE